MTFNNPTRRVALAAALALVLTPALASAAEVRVMISGAFRPAFAKISSDWAKKTGNTVVTLAGPSFGETPEAVPNRLKRGEPGDLVIVARESLDNLSRDGLVVKGSETDLILSMIAMGVKTGRPVPDIRTLDGFKQALRDAKSIAYSDSASGIYIETEMFKKLGVPEVAAKARKIPATPVGEILVAEKADIGFQQVPELMAVPGVTIAGVLPEGAQRPTYFSAGIAAKAQQPALARALLAELTSPANYAAIRATGVEPAAAAK
jgi:molybdate transport system substrate-binding protein